MHLSGDFLGSSRCAFRLRIPVREPLRSVESEIFTAHHADPFSSVYNAPPGILDHNSLLDNESESERYSLRLYLFS